MLCRIIYQPTEGMHRVISQQLPSGGLIGYDPVEEIMVVDIPDDDFPADADFDAPPHFVDTHLGPCLVGLSKAGHTKWHEHLDKRYKEHEGKFRPRIANGK